MPTCWPPLGGAQDSGAVSSKSAGYSARQGAATLASAISRVSLRGLLTSESQQAFIILNVLRFSIGACHPISQEQTTPPALNDLQLSSTKSDKQR